MNLPIWPSKMLRIARGMSLGDLVVLEYKNPPMDYTARSLWNPANYELEGEGYELAPCRPYDH